MSKKISQCRFWPRKRDVFCREGHFLPYALAICAALTRKMSAESGAESNAGGMW